MEACCVADPHRYQAIKMQIFDRKICPIHEHYAKNMMQVYMQIPFPPVNLLS